MEDGRDGIVSYLLHIIEGAYFKSARSSIYRGRGRRARDSLRKRRLSLALLPLFFQGIYKKNALP